MVIFCDWYWSLVIVSKEKHLEIGKIFIRERARAVGMLVSLLSIRTHFKDAAYFFLDVILNIKYLFFFYLFSLFFKSLDISIGNNKQSKSFRRNPILPEVFVISSNGQGLGSQPKVKIIDTSFLITWKLNGNQLLRR